MANCPFCGSDKIKIEDPDFVKLGGDGEYHPKTYFCCLAQKRNAAYVKEHYNPGEEPEPEEVSEL